MPKPLYFKKRRGISVLTIVVATTFGIWQLGEGAYIYVKAQLAQYLLLSAWQETKRTKNEVKPWSWADTWPVAKLEVSAHNVELIVLAGDTGRTLAFGPGYNLASVKPGDTGNSIISAHRDTHFEFLRHLKLRDKIVIENQQGNKKVFTVNKIEIVDSRNSSVGTGGDIATLTLVTCYPFDALQAGGPLRYVVEADELQV